MITLLRCLTIRVFLLPVVLFIGHALAYQEKGLEVEFVDDFLDSDYADIQDGYQFLDNFWSANGNAGIQPVTTGGMLSMAVSGANSRMLSKVHYLFNFFEQPLKLSFVGLDMQVAATNQNVSIFRIALSSDGNSAYIADDSIAFDIKHVPGSSSGSPWKITFVSRVDGVDAVNKPSIQLTAKPTRIDILLDQTGYQLVAYNNLDIVGEFKGLHLQSLANWTPPTLTYVTNPGDASLQLKASSGANSTLNLVLDKVSAVSVLHEEQFNDSSLPSQWTTVTQGSNSTVVSNNGALTLSANSNAQGSAYSGIHTQRDGLFNFQAQPLVLSARGINISSTVPGSGKARFSFNSESALSLVARDTFSIILSDSGAVAVAARDGSTGTLNGPTLCDGDGYSYSYCREWDTGKSQAPIAFELKLNDDKDSSGVQFNSHTGIYYTLTLFFADSTHQSFDETLQASETATSFNSTSLLDEAVKVTHWHQNGGHDTRHSALAVELVNASPGLSDTSVEISALSVTRRNSSRIRPSVFGLVNDTIDMLAAAHYTVSQQPLINNGLIDVTATPFNADSSGSTDSTLALQKAIDYALDNEMTVYFPSGTYRISDTLSCGKKLYRRTNGAVRSSVYGSCILMGQRGGARPTILLSSQSPGFGTPGVDGATRKYVVDIWARCNTQESCLRRDGSSVPPSQTDISMSQPNISFWQMFSDIDIKVESGNPGAVGIQFRAAEGSALQDSLIDVTGAFAGVEGAAGSGGGHAGVEVLGGEYGFYITKAQPAAVLAGITLRNQTQHAIYDMGGMGPLTIVGAHIEGVTGEAIKVNVANYDITSGQLNLIDVDAWGASSTAVLVNSNRAVYLKNVYLSDIQYAHKAGAIDNKNNIVHYFPDVNSPLASGYYHINEYVYAPASHLQERNGDPSCANRLSDGNCALNFEYPIYIDGVKATDSSGNIQAMGEVISTIGAGDMPGDLPARHLWGAQPSFQGAVNVRDYGAYGNDDIDDSTAIQNAIAAAAWHGGRVYFPKGIYRVSSPITLNWNTSVQGAGEGLTIILPLLDSGDFANATPSDPKPLMSSSSNPFSNNQISFLTFMVPTQIANTYALNWTSNAPTSLVRSVNFHLISEFGFNSATGDPAPVNINLPLALVTNNGSGKWYNFNTILTANNIMQAGYRHLAIRNRVGSDTLSMYQVLSQHAHSEENIEISNSENVDLYGVKSEGIYPALAIEGSDGISVFGYSGHATPVGQDAGYFTNLAALPGPFGCYLPVQSPEMALIHVENSHHLRVVNAMPSWRNSSWDDVANGQISTPCYGVGSSISPEYFSILSEFNTGSPDIYTEKAPAGGSLTRARQERPVIYTRDVQW